MSCQLCNAGRCKWRTLCKLFAKCMALAAAVVLFAFCLTAAIANLVGGA